MDKNLTEITDLSRSEFLDLLEQSARLKAELAKRPRLDTAEGKVAALVFEKPSLRTRVTFEVAMVQLGGSATYLGPSDIGLGTRESVPDVARNLSRWVQCIIARVFEHEKITGLAEAASVPVVNALSDAAHPCQALADILTVKDHRPAGLDGAVIAWVGDGNNVCNSLMYSCALLGLELRVATPRGFEPAKAVQDRAAAMAAESGAVLDYGSDPAAAVRDAEFVYTDVWASMGQEEQAAQRAKMFRPFQVNAELMKHARPDAKVLHCLPAHRGEEITGDVIDGPQSVVLDQAENRLHAQRALLARLLAR